MNYEHQLSCEQIENQFQTRLNNWPSFVESSIFESVTTEVATALEIDPGMAKTVALAAMSTVCQGVIDVELPGGHKVPTSLYTIISAESGERKTGTQDIFFKSIRSFEISSLEKYSTEFKKHLIENENWNIHKKELEKMYRRAVRQNKDMSDILHRQMIHAEQQPLTVVQPRFIYSDITPTSLAHSLHENIPFACLISSEAGGVFNGKAMQDLYLYNDIWSGSPITVDRKTSPDFSVIQPRLTMALMLQPCVLKHFLQQRGKAAKQNGLLARTIIMQADNFAGKRKGNTLPPDKLIMDVFYQRCDQLLEITLANIEHDRSRKIVKFNASAKKRWSELQRLIEQDMRPHGLYFHAKDHGSKFMDNVARVAAIIYTFEDYEGDIESSTLEYAFQLCRCYSHHYMKIFAGTPEIIIHTNQLIRDIRKLCSPGSSDTYHFNESIISQRGHNSLRNKSSRKAAIELLAQLGHLKKDGRFEYIFKETLILPHEPELKNGEHYVIDELVLFNEQELYSFNNRRPRWRRKQI